MPRPVADQIARRDASQPVGYVRMLRASPDQALARIERGRADSITCAADGTCAVEGSMNVNMKDFGVNVPSYLGITVKPDVVVTSSFTVKR